MGSVILAIEFKVGESQFSQAAREQVWDYALDLKNFHAPSHPAVVVPVLVATDSTFRTVTLPAEPEPDRPWDPILVSPNEFPELVRVLRERAVGPKIDRVEWENGRYSPTPTIVEAALALYNHHSVSEISRSDAGAVNISNTSATLEKIIQDTRARSEKAICLVTGVPGAGKTLVGLNVAASYRDRTSELYSVYLSGNGPLVKVLSEALARDQVARGKERGKKLSLIESRSQVKAFIQNVHHFRDEYLKDLGAPAEHVVIFDEAQRAWDKEQTSKFMRRRRQQPGFNISEPEYLLSCMDRHSSWSVVICLVGRGQEIHTGEAGMSEWVSSLNRRFPRWHVYASDRLSDDDPDSTGAFGAIRGLPYVTTLPELHLSTSLRSFRAESVSELVGSLLEIDLKNAHRALGLASRYPIALTRDLAKAKGWLKRQARGSERYGIVVSSFAERLKPHSIDVRWEVDPVHWFLDGKEDTRSSFFLEDAATQFQVQGLELDWSCVTWDADLRFNGRAWEYWSFAGSRWKRVQQPTRQQFLKNAYRVLLTRARQGMVIVVPKGEGEDHTRQPSFYDSTYDYLRSVGFDEL